MNYFKCDICGKGITLIENGEAVCNFCGARYSKELVDVKKNAIQTNIEVETQVSLDEIIDAVQNLMEDGAFQAARKELNKAIKLAPNDWRVIIENAKLETKFGCRISSEVPSHQSFLRQYAQYGKNMHISIIDAAIENVKKSINDSQISENEKIIIFNALATCSVCANISIVEYYNEKYYDWTKSYECESYYKLESDRMSALFSCIFNLDGSLTIIDTLDDALSNSNRIEIKAIMCDYISLLTWEDFYAGQPHIIKKYENYRWQIREKYPDYGTGDAYLLPDPKKYSYNNPKEEYTEKKKRIQAYWKEKDDIEIARREEALKTKRIEAYWENHAEERDRLLSEKKNLEEEIHRLEVAKNSLPILDQIKQIEKERILFQNKLKETGLFQFNDRKQIKMKIVELSTALEKAIYQRDTELEKLNQSLRDAHSICHKIMFELSKDR